MDAQVFVWEKKGLKLWWKTQEISLNTLDKTFLLIGNICSQFCGEKPLKRVGKIGSKSLQKSWSKQPPNAPFYRVWKTSRWGLTDRPVDRPTVIFQTVVPSVDRSVDRGKIQRADSLSGRPLVDRGLSREQSFLDGQPCRSTGHLPGQGVHVCARRSTDPVDRLQPQSTWSVD